MRPLGSRWIRLTGAGFLLGAYACSVDPLEAPTAPRPQAPSITGTLAPDPTVWGVADLHAHPAAHLAFGGLRGQAGLLWGDPGLPGGVLKYVPGGDLPDIPACDPETHSADVVDEVSRATRAKVFGLLTQQANYPHVAHGGPPHDGESVYESWPNARDILHQAMNVQSLRRAYEGGLRLMFAATVDSQALMLAMHTTIFPPPFVPSRDVERESAEAQLVYIRNLVSANSDWMEIAATPEQATDAIRSNRLAVILALEMDGLRLEDVQYFVQTYGVGSIVPIHLIDNDVGGTAAYNDVFNAATDLLAPMFGFPNRYISVEPDSALGFHLGWPDQLAIIGPNFGVGPVDYPTAAGLGYSNYPVCNPVGSGVPDEDGTRNSVGLRAPQTLRELMKMGLIVDVAHMGFRSTSETIDLAEATCGYPLVDTHTAIRFRAHPQGGSERDLFEDHADSIAPQGVLGFGTGGRTVPLPCERADEGSTTLASARGGPLAQFNGRQQTVKVVMPPGSRACAKALAAPDDPITTLGVRVLAGPLGDGSAQPYVQIDFDGGHREIAPIGFNRVTTLPLDQGYAASAIASVAVGVLFPKECTYKDGSAVSLQRLDILDPSGATLRSVGPTDLGMGAGMPIAWLGPDRQTFLAYSRCPPDNPALCDPVGPFPLASNEPTAHLRIRVRSGTNDLRSSSPSIAGAKVTGSICADASCTNAPDPCSHPDFTMTPAGGWPKGLELDQYVSIPSTASAAPPAPVAIALCVTQRDLALEPWEIDEVKVDLALDPVRLWTGDYAGYQANVFGGREGAIALGTDANGLAAQFPFADFSPSYRDDGATCNAATWDAARADDHYGDDTTGGTFTLIRPLKIGATPLCLPERGLATYGMLPEFFAAVYHYNRDVYRSLFRSAAATIATWSASRRAALAFATNPTACPVASGSTDASAGDARPPDAESDATGDGAAESAP